MPQEWTYKFHQFHRILQVILGCTKGEAAVEGPHFRRVNTIHLSATLLEPRNVALQNYSWDAFLANSM